MRLIILGRVKGLPKAPRLCVERTVPPDVSLPPREWALHHRLINRKVIVLP